MKKIHTLCAACALWLAGPQVLAQAQQARIAIDAARIENRISPFLAGSCIEDVNHEIYGGLYDQKIFGESFEEPPLTRIADWAAMAQAAASRAEPLVEGGAGPTRPAI